MYWTVPVLNFSTFDCPTPRGHLALPCAGEGRSARSLAAGFAILMRLLTGSPAAPLLTPQHASVARAGPLSCSILDDLKYQLSNADEESRPARDLIENPIAFAYLLVLLALAGGLAYLALEDRRIAERQAQSLREMEDAAAMLRDQGLTREAAVLDRDLRAQRAPPPKEKPKGLAADPYGADDDVNRFQRRMQKKKKSQRK